MSERDRIPAETALNDRYTRFTSVLGKGSFKTVYRAFDSDECLEVAWNKLHVERLPNNVLEKVANEVKLLEQVQHKNIIRFFALLPSHERNGVKTIDFITEQMTSGTLKDYLKRAKAIKLKVIRRWSFNILGAIEYLHAQEPPIMHRDLKCENIFINGHVGEVKIGDLGLSGVKVRDKADSVIGTPEFMAPELYESSYTEKVDIYAFGMCLLEMVTMEYPYSECSNVAQIFKKVYIGEKPKVLDRIKPGPFKNVINACLQREEHRPSATQLLADPLFKEWESDSNTATNSSLLVGYGDSEQGAGVPNGNEADGGVIEWNADLSRTVLVSTEETANTGDVEPSASAAVLQGEQGGGVFKVGLTITIENQVKRVEFSVDPFQDTSKHLAQEMVDVFELPPDQLERIQDVIENQIQVATEQRDAASRNATPQPRDESGYLENVNLEAPIATDTSGLTQPLSDHGPISTDGSVASYNPAVSMSEPAFDAVPDDSNAYIQQPSVNQMSEPDNSQYQNIPMDANMQNTQHMQDGQTSLPVQHVPVSQPQSLHPSLPTQHVQTSGQTLPSQPVQRLQLPQINSHVQAPQNMQNMQQQQHIQDAQSGLPTQHLQAPGQNLQMQANTQNLPVQAPAQSVPVQHVPVHHVHLPRVSLHDQNVQNMQSSQHGQSGMTQQHQLRTQQPLPVQVTQQSLRDPVQQNRQNSQHMRDVQSGLPTRQMQPPTQSLPSVHHLQVPQQNVRAQPPQTLPQNLLTPSLDGNSNTNINTVATGYTPALPLSERARESIPRTPLAEDNTYAQQLHLPQITEPENAAYRGIPVETPQAGYTGEVNVSMQNQQAQHSQSQQQNLHAQSGQPIQNPQHMQDAQASLTSQRHQATSQVLHVQHVQAPQQTLHGQQPAQNLMHSQQTQHGQASIQSLLAQQQSTHVPPQQQHAPQWSNSRDSGSSAVYTPPLGVAELRSDSRPQSISAEDQGSYVQHPEANNSQYRNMPVETPPVGFSAEVNGNMQGSQQVRESLSGQHLQVTHNNLQIQPTQNHLHSQQRFQEGQSALPPQHAQAPTHSLPVQHVPVSQQQSLHARVSNPVVPHQNWTAPSLDGSTVSNYNPAGTLPEPSHEIAPQTIVAEDNNGYVQQPRAGQVSEPDNMQYQNMPVENTQAAYNGEPNLTHSLHVQDVQPGLSSRHMNTPQQTLSQNVHLPHNSFQIQPPQQALPAEKWLAGCLELMDFCSKGNYQDVLEKLEQGYPATFADYDRRTPLHLASARGHPEVAKVLIERGASVRAVDRWGRTPLKDAVLSRHDSVANLLRANGAEEDMAVESIVFCSIMLQSAARGDLEEVRRRLVAGANANFADYDGRTALHLACTEGHGDVAELLLVNEASWNTPDNFGCTPVNDAVRNGHKDCLRVLRQYGAEIPRHLLGAHSDTQHQLGLDLVENAAKGRINAVRKCLRNGANPNFKDYDKRTALHLAAVEGHVDIVETLLQSGSDWTALDRWGTNARDEAVNANQTAVLDELDNWARRSMRRNNSVPGKSMRTVPNGRRLGPSVSSRSLGQSRPVQEEVRPSTSPVLSSMSLQQLFSDDFVERRTLKTSHSDMTSNGVASRSPEDDPEMMERFRKLRKQMEEKLEERYNEECKIVRDNLRATRSRDPRTLPATETLTPPAYGEESSPASERLGAEMERETKSGTSVVSDEGEGVGNSIVQAIVEEIVSSASGALPGNK